MKAGKSRVATIDEYISGFPKDIQAILRKIRATVREAAPDATEAIAYQMPTFRMNGNLVHFAAFKNHIGFYPTPTATKEFRKELTPYESGKGSIRFPLGKPVPYDLIRRIVLFRVTENTAKPKKAR